MEKKTAIIIGAGPAGLTAAYELLGKTDIKPIIYEATDSIGGISRTINYKGNRIDIGGHRFFSKSDRVMDWWKNILTLQGAPSKDELLLDKKYPGQKHNLKTVPGGPDPEKTDKVLLIRKRISRIFFLRKFFDYPVSLNAGTFRNLGVARVVKIGISYVWIRLFPIKKERSLEDFFMNRFGKELYETFFKDYTEKVWGVPCNKIDPDWGAQRVKGVSISKTIEHAIKKKFKKDESVSQKNVETSLIEQFMYPKYGPGQMWETVAEQVLSKGGEIHMNHEATGLVNADNKISGVRIIDKRTGQITVKSADYVFSTMPVKELIAGLENRAPEEVRKISDGLIYRDFITVGILLKKLAIHNETDQHTVGNIVPDNWIYIQERDVSIGRLQIFNNWSPYMLADFENTAWIGLEYFCSEGDSLWSKSDEEFKKFAAGELEKIGVIRKEDILDSTCVRVPKTYPAYFGTYHRFDEVKKYVDSYENLFLIGRNGMHRYNNQDHSMLTAILAVENIAKGIKTKDNIWAVNTEEEYHEGKGG
jgi:protoporphyrinogen oxidase